MANTLHSLGVAAKDRPLQHTTPRKSCLARFVTLVCYIAAGCLLFELLTFIFSSLVGQPIPVTARVSQFLLTYAAPAECPVDFAGLQVNDTFKGANQFALYRAIGNDLPPRHAVGQSYNNIKFILENEPDLPGLDRRWIINKIVNKTEEQRLVRLLESYGQRYEVLRLDLEEASKVPVHYEGFHDHDVLRRNLNVGEGLRASMYRASVIDHMYREKNIHVINNNGARNAALESGVKAGYRWIMPWDGNCFLTASAWKTMRETIIAKGTDAKYFHVPMARLQDNALLFDATYCPEAVEEPQLIFRNDSKARFNNHQRYGRRPKVDMILRLGIPGPWDEYVKASAPYFEAPYNFTKEQDVGPSGVPVASWVARLYSGSGAQEVATKDSADLRKLARCQGVHLILDQVDAMAAETVYGFSPSSLLIWNETVLDAEKNAYVNNQKANPRLVEIVDRVVECADKAMGAKAFTRRDITPEGPIGVNPRVYEKPEEAIPHSRLQPIFRNVTCLALANYFTGKKEYATLAARHLSSFFLDSDSSLSPEALVDHLFGAVREDGSVVITNVVGSIEMRDFFYFLDAVKLVGKSEVLTPMEMGMLQNWFSRYIELVMWRTEGSMLGEQRGTDGFDGRSMGPRGINYDLQMAAVAAFTGNTTLFMHYVKHSKARMQNQFAIRHNPQPYAENGYFGSLRFEEENVVESLPYALKQLVPWFILARVGRAAGVDLFNFKHIDSPKMAMLRSAATLYIPGFQTQYAEDVPKHSHYYKKMQNLRKRIEAQYTEDLTDASAYLYHTAILAYPELATVDVAGAAGLYESREGPFEEFGVYPYWNLGFTDSFLVSGMGGNGRGGKHVPGNEKDVDTEEER